MLQKSAKSLPLVILSDSEDELEAPRKKSAADQLPQLFARQALNSKVEKQKKRQGKRQLHPSRHADEAENAPRKRAALVFSTSQGSEEPGRALPHSNGSMADHNNASQLILPGKRAPCLGVKLWSQKHAPRREEDLVVNKKKVQELKGFLENHLHPEKEQPSPSLLMVTGPPGSGKSSVLEVLASQLGFEITEWQAPIPTLWTEHSFQGMLGQQYVSKLDAFDSFVSHAKLAPLRMQAVGGTESTETQDRQSKKRKLILVEDLPHAAAAEQRVRLMQSLETLADTTRSPVVVMRTTSIGSGESRSENMAPSFLFKGLPASGVTELAFAGASITAITKTLQRIADAESVPLSAEQCKALASAANGDLLSAIETLQLYSIGKVDLAMLKKKAAKKQGRKKAAKTGSSAEDVASKADLAALHKDTALSSFHALGKLLYNKREGHEAAEAMSQEVSQRPEATSASQPLGSQQMIDRGRLRQSPEDILMASGMEMPSVVAFLHENFPHFIHDESISDVATVSDYLSQADLLLVCSGPQGATDVTLENLAAGNTVEQACGGSVAARGVMWGNAHPAPKRWLPLKGPVLFTVNKAVQQNCLELNAAGSLHFVQLGVPQMAASVIPFMRTMCSFPAASQVANWLPRRWARVWQSKLIVEENLAACGQAGQLQEDGKSDTIEDAISEDES